MSEASIHSRVSSEEESIAKQFVRARLEARALRHYPGAVPADLASAYRCQDAAIARWPRPIAGWKVTGRWPPTQERVMGPVFEATIRSAAPGKVVECPVFAGGFSAFEPEVIVRVGQDAPPEQTDWMIAEAADMVGELCIGAEVASSPLSTLIELGATAIVSDFGCNFGIVVGNPIPDWRKLEEVTARLYVDDRLVHEGTRSVRDGVLEAFAFALAKCASRGYPLRAGMLIATGTVMHADRIQPAKSPPPALQGALPVQASRGAPASLQPGQSGRLVFDNVGEVVCRTVKCAPLT